jgi:hypothetical protein
LTDFRLNFRRIAALAVIAVLLLACSGRDYFETAGLRTPVNACLIDPGTLGQAEAVPDIVEDNGCEVRDAYKVQSLAGVQFSQAAIMNCGMASPVNDWLGGTVQDSAAQAFGERVVSVDIAASYACRPRNNSRGAKMSEHGYGNAIDISAFTLAGGRKVSVLEDWNGRADARKFLRRVRGEACGKFATVLGPGSDPHHRNHIHLDLQNRRSGNAFCH